jgi:hypothetical protein
MKYFDLCTAIHLALWQMMGALEKRRQLKQLKQS